MHDVLGPVKPNVSQRLPSESPLESTQKAERDASEAEEHEAQTSAHLAHNYAELKQHKVFSADMHAELVRLGAAAGGEEGGGSSGSLAHR